MAQRTAVMMRALCVLALSIAIHGCGRTSPGSAPPAETADADQILRKMSDTLATAGQLTFTVKRHIDAGLLEGRSLPEEAQVEVAVARPDKLMAKSSSKDEIRHFYADGQNVSLFDETMKLYSTVPSPGTIDEVVVALGERYGFTPPIAELAVNDPYKKISEHGDARSYQGKEAVGGVDCHRVKVAGSFADAEFWVGTADTLPRKLVVTFNEREGKPTIALEFSDWNLKAQLDEGAFRFEPPKDAEKIAMVTTAEMEKAATGTAGIAK
jgi:hypothetical protein